MTATKPLDMPLPFVLKQEKEDNVSEENSDDESDESDSDSVSSLQQPSILDKNSLNDCDPSDEFLRLTSMVRRVYFSYLHKSIINNYNVCCKSKDLSRNDLKRFASQMELYAVRGSLESSLYRQAMLKMISDVKTCTSRQKIHKKLSIFLEAPPTTADAAVQTCEDLLPSETKHLTVEEKIFDKYTKEETKSPDEKITSPTETSSANQIESSRNEEPLADLNPAIKREPGEVSKTDSEERSENEIVNNEEHKQELNLLDTNLNPQYEDDNTQDSLMQHMENMFCESDDSSDLTSLIEKCSGVTKTNIDKEIANMCQDTPLPVKNTLKFNIKTSDSVNLTPLSQESSTTSTSKRKLSFMNYKNKKKRALEGLTTEDVQEDKQTKKLKGIWFVERIHQVSKLRAKMLELSVRNYRKHGRIRSRFFELFGDDDGEDLQPESPIHIEEHLTACKERIAPWVVKYLMPFYSKKVIQDRPLFKAVAKHLTDMLIIDNTFPEEEYVNQYIKDYFRNKLSIKSQADIYI